MEQAALFGLKPAETWDLTTRELTMYFRGRADADTNEWRRTIVGAFYGVLFDRKKRLSGEVLKKVLRRLDTREPRRQTIEQMYEMAKLWTSVLGGRT